MRRPPEPEILMEHVKRGAGGKKRDFHAWKPASLPQSYRGERPARRNEESVVGQFQLRRPRFIKE
jgi:hypothetical protein